ncbi:MAG: hypothetical protein JST93_36235 [Acidobacteria bacterium]|nr:hypothetical protein [Acidobacteriota bacterium]
MNYLMFFSAFFVALTIWGQNPSYQWHTFYNVGTYGWQGGIGNGVATDGAGAVYVVGVTHNPSTFGSGAPIHSTAGQVTSGRTAFIIKFAPSGALLWYTLYTGPQGAAANAVAVDSTGDVYVTGDGALYGDGSQAARNSGGPQSMFVLKLNSSGQYQWHTCYGDGDTGLAIAVDKVQHRVYATGYKQCCTSFSAPVAAVREHVNGINDIYTLALDSAGTHLWHTFQGPGGGSGRAVGVDSGGNVVVGGGQNGQMVTLRLNGAGVLQTYLTWGSGEVRGVAVDGSDNLYFTGGSWPGWSGPSGQAPVHTCGPCGYSMFLLKTGPNLDYQLHALYSNNYDQIGQSVALDGAGLVYVTGRDPHYGGPGAFAANSLHDNLNQPGHYLAAFSTNLQYMWHTTYGAYWDDAHGVAVDGNRNVYVTGGSGQMWYGDGNTMPLAPQSGGDSVFVQKLSVAATPARLVVNRSLSRLNGQIQINISITNTGGSAAANVVLTTGRINATSGAPLPQTLGAVAAGATVQTTIAVPGSAGNTGAPATVTLAGSYSGGTFSSAGRVVLP